MHYHLSYYPDVAQKFDKVAAVVFGYIKSWNDTNAKSHKAMRGKCPWMFNTFADIAHGAGVSERRAITVITKMADFGIIRRGCFNDKARNRTGWYTVYDDNGDFILDQFPIMQPLQNLN